MPFQKPSTVTVQTGNYEFKGGMTSTAENYIDNSFPYLIDSRGNNIFAGNNTFTGVETFTGNINIIGSAILTVQTIENNPSAGDLTIFTTGGTSINISSSEVLNLGGVNGVSIGSASGTVTISPSLTVSGSETISGTLTVNGNSSLHNLAVGGATLGGNVLSVLGATLLTGALVQSGGFFDLAPTGNSAVVTTGNLALDATAQLNLGANNATSINLGNSNTATSIAGKVNFTQAMVPMPPSGVVTLNSSQYNNTIIYTGGGSNPLTGDVTIYFPAQPGVWILITGGLNLNGHNLNISQTGGIFGQTFTNNPLMIMVVAPTSNTIFAGRMGL